MKIKTKKRGRKPFIKKILKVKKYREKGLSLGEIAKIMEVKKTQIARWDKYEVIGN